MSIITNQFPHVKWRDGYKYLWNPIRKQALKNRPEEHVRLRVIEYLLEAGWSKHRISTEEGVTSTQKGKLRTDLICYTDDFNPFLLVECKAPSVDLSSQTAGQIARYNRQVKAPYLLMTNGQIDLWYSFNDGKPVLQKELPEMFRKENHRSEKPFSYWQERGFAGLKAKPKLHTWLAQILNAALENKASAFRYLSFKKKLSDLDLNHYYSIYSFSGRRIALAFIATAYGGTRLAAIINKAGENSGVLEINLDLLFSEESPNSSFYDAKGSTNLDIRKKLEWNPKAFRTASFARQVDEVFK